MDDLVMKQGDTKPDLRMVLTDGPTPVPLLAAASIRLVLTDVDTREKVVDEVVTGASDGSIVYEWDPADTAVPRRLRAEATVTWVDASVQTFPADAGAYVLIVPALRLEVVTP